MIEVEVTKSRGSNSIIVREKIDFSKTYNFTEMTLLFKTVKEVASICRVLNKESSTSVSDEVEFYEDEVATMLFFGNGFNLNVVKQRFENDKNVKLIIEED